MKEFKSWKDIRDWAEANGYKYMVARMDLNNDCWNSSDEFGRSQVEICDAMRFADSETARQNIAQQIEKDCQNDLVTQLVIEKDK